jgi:hypothetical protein
MEDIEILSILNENTNPDRLFNAPFLVLPKKISFYTRYEKFKVIYDYEYWGSIQKITHPCGIEILLVAVHIQSKLHSDEITQLSSSIEIANQINLCEEEQKHTRTIVIGDFNMNPFELGLVSPDAFHAVMDQQVAATTKTVRKKIKKFFYNPMWSCLGDMSKGTSGTYYYSSSKIPSYYWNTFDQVLIRPH